MKKNLLYFFILLFAYELKTQTPICFYPSSDNPTVSLNPRGIHSADFNADGKLDLAIANSAANNVSILLGTSSGTFATAINYSVGTGPRSLVSGDFNSDGMLDLAVGNVTSSDVSLLFGLGTGFFSNAINYTVGTNPRGITSGDFNSDGKTDLAVANMGSNTISMLLGSVSGTFAVSSFTTGPFPAAIHSADFNGDGNADLVVANASYLSLLFGTGTGTFNNPVLYMAGFTPSAIKSGDFDADGNTDLAVTNFGSNAVQVFMGSATGTLGVPTGYIVGTGPESLTLNDFNNDGTLDIAVSNTNSHDVFIFLNSGNAFFTSVLLYPIGTNPGSITSGDFNGDGKKDLAAANVASGSVKILLNDDIPTLSFNTQSVICQGNSITITVSGAASYTWGSGAISNSITVAPTEHTGYLVTGTSVNGCTNTAVRTIIIDPCTGINQFDQEQLNFTVYPNPLQKEFFIKMETNLPTEISVFNLSGQKILYTKSDETVSTVDLSLQPPGIYFIEINQAGKTGRTKLIKH